MELPILIRRRQFSDTQPIPVDELRRLLKEMNEGEHERQTVPASRTPVPEWSQ